jgi:hypothetical protein
MALEKKSLVNKKASTTTKSNTKSKVDTSAPKASKVVSAKPIHHPVGPNGN